ncbi:MAG: MBL fold metallo-hydrolase [Candidatus Riflebacteria bacterium]|nr:MBL fold metallo-hydrolase [Candidatus Riflebacteria bacterium]
MKISFHGAAGCVTGSCHLIKTDKTAFLVDCGMFQGSKAVKENNYSEFPFKPSEIDFVLLTHAHIDHSGLLPKLVKKGFKGKIYATNPTVDLAAFLLPDSARIQESECILKNRRGERKGLEPIQPIYDEKDAEKAISLFRGVNLNQKIMITDEITATYQNAGHIFGSAFIEIEIRENSKTTKIVFSGDIGSLDHPIVKDPEMFSNTDFLVIESTYGDRIRKDESNEQRLIELAAVVNSALKKGGNLIIPAFALERSQDLMHDLLILIDRKSIPDAKIVIDSPLAINATKVFAKYPEYFDEDATKLLKNQGSLFSSDRFRFTADANESKELNNSRGTIILSASGMCDAGRIKHHLKHNLWKKEATILFVGFQAEGTLGRLLLDGAKSVRIHGEEVRVEATITKIPGYSGHADQNGLIDWLKNVKEIPGTVFVVHGEDSARAELAKCITAKYGFKCEVPLMNSVFDLVKGKPSLSETPVATILQPVKTSGKDSFNLYAEFSLKLAEKMRSIQDESSRTEMLQKLLSII